MDPSQTLNEVERWRPHQLMALVLASLVCLWMAPGAWHLQPDTGIYVGGAQSLLEEGRYWFNGQPILIYFPGFSALLALPIAIFGIDFQILHLFTALIAISILWLSRAHFTRPENGLTGLLVPVLIAFAGIFHEQVVYILSDGAFLALVIAMLLAWRSYERGSSPRWLLLCAAIAAFLPFVRMQGVFALGAFGIAYGLHLLRGEGFNARTLARWVLISLIAGLPFLLWTYRNYILYTPDNFNMLNAFLFGQKGLPQAAVYGDPVPDWIDATWKIGIYNFLYLLRDLGETLVGAKAVELVRMEVLAAAILGLTALGSPRWFKGASVLERLYVLFSLGFIAFWSLRSNSLYTVARHWLPVLPFLLLAMGFGLSVASRWLSRFVPQAIPGVLIGALLLLVTANGVASSLHRVQTYTFRYYEQSADVLARLREYVNREVPRNGVLAVIDWGVLPLVMDRRSHLMLNDPSGTQSLEIIARTRPSHLIFIDGLSRSAKPALKLAESLPHVFRPVLKVKPDGPGPAGAIFAVDADAAAEELASRRQARLGAPAGEAP